MQQRNNDIFININKMEIKSQCYKRINKKKDGKNDMKWLKEKNGNEKEKTEKWKATAFSCWKSFSLDKRDTARSSENEIRRKTDIKVCTCTKNFPFEFPVSMKRKIIHSNLFIVPKNIYYVCITLTVEHETRGEKPKEKENVAWEINLKGKA